MNCIDFDAHFEEALHAWIHQNAPRFETEEDMEEEYPEVYQNWADTPAEWLGGETPARYFEKYGSSVELIELLKEYLAQEVSVPDLLLDRLMELADEDALMALLRDGTAPLEARLCAVELLRQLESTAPMVDYIRWQAERKEDGDLLEASLDSLREMGEKAVKPAKIAFQASGKEGKEALLDLLADYPGDPDVFSFALEQFKTTKTKRALYAGYLAKLDDDHALEALLDVAEGNDVTYTDFMEIRSAIERLGSEAPVRDWSQDESYRAFRRLQKSQAQRKEN